MNRRRDKRQRNNVLQTRANDEERDAIKARADRVGLTVGTFLRQLALGLPLPARAVRHTRIEIETLVRVLGELGKIGSNLNQLTKYANMGRVLERSVLAALREVEELRLPLMQALGKEPMRREPEQMDDPAP
jgi:Bacterial mobilisation protein (MobC)